MKQLREFELGWVVGIYEGEGSCGRSGWGHISLSVHQKERWLLDKFQGMFGGRIGLQS